MKELLSIAFAKDVKTTLFGLPRFVSGHPFSEEEAEEFSKAASTVLRRTPKKVIEVGLRRFSPLNERVTPEERKLVLIGASDALPYLQTEASPKIVQALIKNHVLRKINLIEGNKSPFERRQETEKEIGLQAPWVIVIDITNDCNLNCEGCYAGNSKKGKDPSLESLDKLVAEAKDAGVSSVAFSGGEPLLRTKEVVELEKRHPELSYVVFTNGTLLTEEKAQEFLTTGAATFFLFHLEGNIENTNKCMGEDVFQKSVKSMAILKEMGIPFGFSIMINQLNFNEVTPDGFLDFLKDQGCVGGVYFPYVPIGTNPNPELVLNQEQRKELTTIAEDLRKKECSS